MKLLYDYEHEDDILHLEENIFKPRIFPETMEGNLKKISLFFLTLLLLLILFLAINFFLSIHLFILYCNKQ